MADTDINIKNNQPKKKKGKKFFFFALFRLYSQTIKENLHKHNAAVHSPFVKFSHHSTSRPHRQSQVQYTGVRSVFRQLLHTK